MASELRLARSARECHVYLALSPCECGDTGYEMVEFSEIPDPAGPLWRIVGRCPNCGRTRQFEFRAATEPAPPPPSFGGDAPSQLIDAGQFLALSERAAEHVPSDPYDVDPDRMDDTFEAIGLAVGSVEEVLKFIPPGADRVPREALWEPSSFALYDREPQSFSRPMLLATLRAYRDIYDDYARM